MESKPTNHNLNTEETTETLSEKLDRVDQERDDRLAEIQKKSGDTVPLDQQSPVVAQPDVTASPSIREYAVNTQQDEVDELLDELFKYAIYHPEASAENTFPFVRVMLKERAINLANGISAVESGDKRMADGLERVMGMLKSVWDTFQLDNNQTRQHLIDAVNARIADLHEKPEIMRHKLLIVEKAMQDIEDKYDVPNAQRNTFGGGILG